MTTEAHEPRTTAEVGGMGHSVKRKEDPRFIRGQGEYIDDVDLPGSSGSTSSAARTRTPRSRASMPPRRSRSRASWRSSPAPTSRRPACTGCRPSPATSRWCCRPTPSCTRPRRSPRSSRRRATSPPTASPRSTVEYEPLPVIVDPLKALEPDAFVLRPDRGPRQGEQPHLALGVGRQGGRRRGPRRRRGHGRARTSTSRASTSPRSRRAAASPTGTPSAAS